MRLTAIREMPLFDQELLRQAEAKGRLTEKAYKDARAACLKATRSNGIDAVLAQHKLDAIVSLTSGPAWLIDHSKRRLRYRRLFLAGGGRRLSAHYRSGGPLPGIAHRLSFFGAAFSEPTLIKLGSGFEGVAHARVAPRFLPSLV